MSVNLKNAMHAAALAESLGDTEARASGALSNTRPTTSRIRRRRAAQQAGTSMVGAAAVAAIVVGGSAIRSHNTAVSGPSTSLSKRAGAECGKPFDPAGKSTGPVSMFADSLGVAYANSGAQFLRFGVQLGDNQTREELDPQWSVSPETAVILRDGIVVGIVPSTPSWAVPYAGIPSPTEAAAQHDPMAFVPIAETMNCLGVVPTPVRDAMFDVVLLRDYPIAGQTGTDLVVSASVKAPHDGSTALVKDPVDLSNSNLDLGVEIVGDWRVVGFYLPMPDAKNYAFNLTDYLRVKDTPGADVPLYGVAGPDNKPTSTPAPARFKAHASGEGSLVITVDGARYGQVYETRMGLG
jgi:hypothetical protein